MTAFVLERELATILSRVGFLKQILRDQGTNFMGRVMQQLRQTMVVQPLHTSVYYPQTNGPVEWFNGTLKHMFRTFARTMPRKWPRWLPLLLFAVQEAP